VRCDDLARALSASSDGEPLDGRAARHVETCLRCQAELVQYRKLVRVLRTLRTEVLSPGPSLAADILAGLEQAGERSAVRALLSGRRPRSLVAVALAGAATGGAAVALVLRCDDRSKGRPSARRAILGGRRRGQ
jgi:anti-sigma factor RsiW